MLNSRELMNLQENREIWIYSSFTIGDLVKSLSNLGVDLDAVRITPKNLGVLIQIF